MLPGRKHSRPGKFEMTQNQISDQELGQLLAVLQHDPKNEDLWKALYLKIRRFVYAVAFRVLNGNEELAKDATQVVFIRLSNIVSSQNSLSPGSFLATLQL